MIRPKSPDPPLHVPFDHRRRAAGICCHPASQGTFYQGAPIADLPAPLNDPGTFFRRAPERELMAVAAAYFDVNPGRLRRRPSTVAQWLRFSLGPPIDNVRVGLVRLEEMVAEGR